VEGFGEFEEVGEESWEGVFEDCGGFREVETEG
jgi:hypothetical protein